MPDKNYHCKDDQDFPEIIIINYPFSLMTSLDSLKVNEKSLINELQKCFDVLITQGCQIISIACNTLHVLLDHISIPKNVCIRIDDTIFQAIKDHHLKKVLLFSTETTGLFRALS